MKTVWKQARRGLLYCGYAIACIFLLTSSGFGGSENKRLKDTEFGVGVEAGHGLHQFHNTCLLFQIFFVSDKFFRDLRVRNTPKGMEFKKGATTYLDFRDQIVLDVQISIFKCPPSNPYQVYPLGYGEGLLSGASFDLHWKGPSNDLHPVIPLSITEQHGIRWNYFLRIPSKDVPLSDALVGDILLRKGTTHYEFTACLAP